MDHKNLNTFRFFYYSFFFILHAILLSACSESLKTTSETAQEELTLHMGWFPAAGSIGFYVAKDKGYYRDGGKIGHSLATAACMQDGT